jgi:hypothetical protein
MIAFGVLIGWGVSMAITCGTFDTTKFTLDIMNTFNCTIPATTPYCADVYHDARRSANDLALQRCFFYCWDGLVYGMLVAFISLICAACAKHRIYICDQWNKYAPQCCKHKKGTTIEYEMNTQTQPDITYETHYVEFK